jgi:signal transduction histidine kinase
LLPGQITPKTILRVLIAGFALVIALLLAAGFIGIRNIESIRESAASLVHEQTVTNRLIREIQHQQVSLSEVFSILARDPDSVDADKILAQLDETNRNIDRTAASASNMPQQHLLLRLKEASNAFSLEAHRLLEPDEPESFASRDLFRRHEEVVSIVSRLISAGYQKVMAAQQQIDQRSARLLKESLLLVGACLLFAVVCSALTVRLARQLLRKMEWQAGELSRVSWHLLENQESAARRFSHELHDELGQSLAAVKANLVAVESELGLDRSRLDDCLRLVDEAIDNVRQLSQLLHPTILDDFGLDAGLRWLCEGFTHRTGIDVDYTSKLHRRLPDETETHLFRIAQEALTNVARHSGATRVSIDLSPTDGEIRLTIRDNGRGLRPGGPATAEGLGMIGMRARARSAGGDLALRSAEGKGVAIEVRVPAEHEFAQHEKAPHSVS